MAVRKPLTLVSGVLTELGSSDGLTVSLAPVNGNDVTNKTYVDGGVATASTAAAAAQSTANTAVGKFASGQPSTLGTVTADSYYESPTSYSGTSVSHNVAAKNDFVFYQSGNASINLYNALSGHQGTFIIYPASTSYSLSITANLQGGSACTTVKDANLTNVYPTTVPTVYSYAFLTVNGINYCVISKMTTSSGTT